MIILAGIGLLVVLFVLAVGCIKLLEPNNTNQITKEKQSEY